VTANVEPSIRVCRGRLPKKEIPMTLRAVINGEEAIYYLAGDGIFYDRTRFPIPK
jgi:hypothetical protein